MKLSVRRTTLFDNEEWSSFLEGKLGLADLLGTWRMMRLDVIRGAVELPNRKVGG